MPKASRPIDPAQLRQLAMAYVARYATSSKKLAGYLSRKLAEKGWSGEGAPDIVALVEQMQAAGYIDDRAYAEMRSGALTRRGFGSGRIRQSLYQAGIAADIARPVIDACAQTAYETALAFARRKKIGPFAVVTADARTQQRAMAAFIRAGHDFRIARQILDLNEDFVQDD